MNSLEAEKELQKAIDLHKNGHLLEAKGSYVAIIDAGTENPHAYHNLSLIISSDGNYNRSVQLLQKARDIDSSIEQFWISELKLHHKFQNWGNFVSLFESAIKRHRTIGVINCVFEKEPFLDVIRYADAGTAQKLIEILKVTIKNEALIDRLVSIGEVYKPALDLISIAEISLISEKDKEIIKRMISQSKYSECLKFIEDLSKDKRDNENFLVERKVACLVFLTRDEEAKLLCLSAIFDGTDTATINNILASILFREENFRDAEKHWKKAIEMDGEFIEAYFNLGKMYDIRGDLVSASQCFSIVIKLYPNHAGALFSLGMIQHRANMFDKAIELYLKTMEVNPNNHRCALSLASLFLEKKQHADAKMWIDRVGMKDQSFFYYQVVGTYCAATGDDKNAVRHLKKALKLDPGNVDIQFSTTLALTRVGELEKAADTIILCLEKSNFDFLPAWDLLIFCLGGLETNLATKYFNRLKGKCTNPKIKDRLLGAYHTLCDYGTVIPGFDRVQYSFPTLKITNERTPRVVTLKNFGRSGTGMFHSLIDGHNEVITTPSIFFSEYFHPSHLDFFLKNGPQGIVDKLFEKYAAFFDSRRPEPIDTVGHGKIYSIALREGLLALGPKKNEHIEIEKSEFQTIFDQELSKFKTIDLGTIFVALNIAYDRIVFPDHKGPKEVLFYHIHNPSRIVEDHMNRQLAPKNIVMIREPLQSLESWLTKPLIDECIADYTAIVSKIVGILSNISTTRYNSGPYYGLRLEDIKADPKRSLQDVATFLGISFDNSLLEMTSAGKKWWGDPASPDYETEGSSPFGKTAINRKIGSVLSENDLYFFEIMLAPFKRQFGYPIFSDRDVESLHGLRFLEEKLEKPLDFEMTICEKNSISETELVKSGQFQNLRKLYRYRLNLLRTHGGYQPLLNTSIVN